MTSEISTTDPSSTDPSSRDQSSRDQSTTNEPTVDGQSPTTSFPFDTLTVRPWDDPLIEKLGHDPRSEYVEKYWTSILGPSATLLLRRLANGLEIAPDGFEIDTLAWAQELGLGIRGGKHGPFWRSLDRTARFGATRRNGALLVVHRKLPPLNLRQVERLPDHLRAAHRVWEAHQLAELGTSDAA